MADLDYTIGVNTNQAERNVDRLKRQVSGLGETFGNLRGVLGKLGAGAFVASTIQWADSIQDVADASSIATATILGFNQAVSESGGTAQDANTAVLKLSETIGQAKEGNKSAIESFAKVGVTLQEIQELSNEDIFRRVIAGLGAIKDSSRRAAAQIELVGRGTRGIQFDKVSASMEVYSERNQSVASAVKSTADAQENLGKIFVELQKALLQIIEPISKVIAGIDTTSKTFTRFMDAIKEAGKWVFWFVAALAGITVIGRISRIFFAAMTAIRNGAQYVRDAIDLLIAVFRITKGVAGKLGQVFSGLKYVAEPASDFIIKNWKKLSLAIVATSGALSGFFNLEPPKWMSNFLDSAIAKTKELLSLNKTLREKEQEAEVPKFARGGPQGPRRLSEADRADILQERYKRENEERTIAIEKEKEKVKLIQQEIDDVREAGMEHFRNGLLMEEQARQAERMRNLVADISLLNNVLATEGFIKQLDAQNELIGLYGREYEFKRELLAIDAERQTAIENIMANLRTMGAEATQEDIARAQREIELAQYVADERLRIFKDRVNKEQAIEGSALEGVKASLRELAESVTPFNVAQQTTRTLFDGMMNGLESFVMTGKFKFKDFALSLIRDLLMIQIRAQATQMFAGIGGFFSSLFAGKAAGGPVKGNTPYVVGEKGPELFVPKSAGTIIPNNKMNGGQAAAAGPSNVTYNTYNISAIDSQSVAQFFAQNRKMALGAVEMARKELPYGS